MIFHNGYLVHPPLWLMWLGGIGGLLFLAYLVGSVILIAVDWVVGGEE